MSAFASMVSNDSIVSIGFHAKALSSNPSRNVAQSLHYPIDVSIKIVSLFSLVSYTTSQMLEGESSFATKCKRGVGETGPAKGGGPLGRGLRCGETRNSL